MKKAQKNEKKSGVRAWLFERFWGFLLWLDLGLAYILGGHQREYPSACLYRKGVIRNIRRYYWMMRFVDWIFLTLRKQPLHCQATYETIRKRLDMPKEYQ